MIARRRRYSSAIWLLFPSLLLDPPAISSHRAVAGSTTEKGGGSDKERRRTYRRALQPSSAQEHHEFFQENLNTTVGGSSSNNNNTKNSEHSTGSVPLIVNGFTADPANYRYFARLTYLNDGRLSYLCGGALISDRMVLTAASCLWDERTKRLRQDAYGATIGYACDARNNCNQPFMSFQAVFFWIHPSWKNQNEGRLDIALFQLASPVPSDVAIPAEPDMGKHLGTLSYGYDDELMSIGYGAVNDSRLKPTSLQELHVGFMPAPVCEEYWGDLFDTAICVYTNDFEEGLFGRGLCFGDSGSPTVIRQRGESGADVVLGVTSFGSVPCEEKERPDVLARVSAGIDFIASVTCTRSAAPWCNNVNCDDLAGEFFDEGGEINLLKTGPTSSDPVDPQTSSIGTTAAAAVATAASSTTCQETPRTRYHPNLAQRAHRTKKCRKLLQKSEAKRNKMCSSAKSNAAEHCCETCQSNRCTYF